MILNSSRLLRRLVHLSTFSINNYQLIMKQSQQSVYNFYRPASHLYLDKVISSPFSQRSFYTLLVFESAQPYHKDNIMKLLDYGYSNVGRFRNFATIANFLVVMYHKYADLANTELVRNIAHGFGLRGFQILREEAQRNINKPHSLRTMKFMVALSKMVGFRKLDPQLFDLIIVQKIKPLFLVFMCQLFYEEGLGGMPFTEKILQRLHQHQYLISGIDFHHILKAQKVIQDPRLSEILLNMEQRSKKGNESTSVQSQSNDDLRVSDRVVVGCFDSYIEDLKKVYL